MIEKKFKWFGESGLHARPAGQLVAYCMHFTSNIIFINCSNNRQGDIKGLFSMMAMEIKKDDEFIVQIKGLKEVEELKKIIQYMVDYDFIEEGPETAMKSEKRKRELAIDPNAPVILPSYIKQEDYIKYKKKIL